MSLGNQVIKGMTWLSIFKIISQSLSWAATIFVARMLTAKDYGLMEMATVFTGYIEFFVEFGISAAIINKKELRQSELSTLFWFLLLWGLFLGSLCFVIAPLTAWYFNIFELQNITTCVGILFIISSLVILPRSILHRDLEFKTVGAIDALSVTIACIIMLALAYNGAGPWTLLFGTISREFTRLICLYSKVKFRPTKHFSISELTPIIKFGAPIVASSTLFYIYNKSDRFFGGKALGDYKLGFYAIALQLAAMPVEKIMSIFQSAIFPAFSKLKDQPEQFNKLFLKFIHIIYTLVLPLFIGGYLVADELIPLVLGDKWRDSILPFKYLVIGQLFVSLGSPLNIIHTGRGKPSWTLYANSILCPIMFISFYFSSKLGSAAELALPWILIYPLVITIYILLTLRSLSLPLIEYFKAIKHPIMGTILMGLSVITTKSIAQNNLSSNIFCLIIPVISGAMIYSIYTYIFSRNILKELREI